MCFLRFWRKPKHSGARRKGRRRRFPSLEENWLENPQRRVVGEVFRPAGVRNRVTGYDMVTLWLRVKANGCNDLWSRNHCNRVFRHVEPLGNDASCEHSSRQARQARPEAAGGRRATFAVLCLLMRGRGIYGYNGYNIYIYMYLKHLYCNHRRNHCRNL